MNIYCFTIIKNSFLSTSKVIAFQAHWSKILPSSFGKYGKGLILLVLHILSNSSKAKSVHWEVNSLGLVIPGLRKYTFIVLGDDIIFAH